MKPLSLILSLHSIYHRGYCYRRLHATNLELSLVASGFLTPCFANSLIYLDAEKIESYSYRNVTLEDND